MQLTQHTDYGLRLLIVLARMGGGPISLPEFAADQKLSYHHVAKVAQEVSVGRITNARDEDRDVANLDGAVGERA